MRIHCTVWKLVNLYENGFEVTEQSFKIRFLIANNSTPEHQIHRNIFTSLRVYIQDMSTNVHNSFAYNGLKMERDHNGFSDIH